MVEDSLGAIGRRYNRDKAVHVHYLDNYSHYLGDRRHADVKLLVLGIKDGGSLLMWRDYIERGTQRDLILSGSRLTTSRAMRRAHVCAKATMSKFAEMRLLQNHLVIIAR